MMIEGPFIDYFGKEIEPYMYIITGYGSTIVLGRVERVSKSELSLIAYEHYYSRTKKTFIKLGMMLIDRNKASKSIGLTEEQLFLFTG